MSVKKNPKEEVLKKEEFNEKETEAFTNIINYAKLCQQGKKENLQSYINEQVDEVVKNEIFENKI